MSPAIDLLLEDSPFEENPAEFLAAVTACAHQLRDHFPEYELFLRDHLGHPVPETFATLQQVQELPALFLPVLKRHSFQPKRELQYTVQLTSSGTTGNPSVIPLDAENMHRRVQAMTRVYRAMGILTQPVRALCFLLDPATTRMAGSLVIDRVLRESPEVQSIQYLAHQGSTGPQFEMEQAANALSEAAAQGPVLIVGYPALIAVAMQMLSGSGRRQFPLPEGSVVLTGGGWKSFLPGVSLDQQEFRQRSAEFFQLPSAAIRDMFGLSECPAVFLQCPHGQYHVPRFAWAQAIDPETNQDVPAGEIGLLQLTVPLTTCYPLLKILTTDKVEIRTKCDCGISSPYLIPRGRVTAARFETCAMKIGKAVG